jgi:hypothetical protein
VRIFLVLDRSPNPSFASNLWKWNLHDPLVDLGHDVVLWDGGIQPLFDVDPKSAACVPLRAKFSADFLLAVADAHRARPLDLVLTYVSDSHLEPAAIEQVHQNIAPIVNFFCNNVHQFHLVERTARYFDRCLVPEAEAIPKYRRAGATPIFWPMAANPKYYRPIDTPLRYDATFAGQRYADRGSLVLPLLEGGVTADAFGQSWLPGAGGGGENAPRGGALARSLSLLASGRNPLRAARDTMDWKKLSTGHAAHLHGPVSDEDYVRLYSESRISLGFSIVGRSPRSSRPPARSGSASSRRRWRAPSTSRAGSTRSPFITRSARRSSATARSRSLRTCAATTSITTTNGSGSARRDTSGRGATIPGRSGSRDCSRTSGSAEYSGERKPQPSVNAA